jgi:hypothetical protein
MSHLITLDLPDRVFRLVQRTAQATNQPIEALLLHALQAALPLLEGLSEEMIEKLTVLETYDDESLWRVMGETVSTEVQQKLRTLLARQQSTALTEAERGQLAALQEQADLVMRRKARAAVLLRFRGKRLPTLAELGQHVSSSA